MQKKSSFPPTKEERYTAITYSAIVTDLALANKPPKGSKELSAAVFKIHKELRETEPQQLNMAQILDKLTSGHSARLGSFEIPGYTAAEKRDLREAQREDLTLQTYRELEAALQEQKKPQLKSTRLVVLDIDDDKGATDPAEVFQYAGARAMYYTFSHQETSVFKTKQNAYRFIFETDEPITSEELLTHVQKALQADLYKVFPGLQPTIHEGKKVGGIDIVGSRFIFGSNKKKYWINQESEPLQLQPFADELALEKELEKYSKKLTDKRMTTVNSATDKEILEMARFLGDTSGLLTAQEFYTVAIGLYNSAQNGIISEETALETLLIIDGNQHKESYYQGFKRPLSGGGATATIGSFIKLATKNGYKRSFTDRYGQDEPTDEPTIKNADMPIKTHLSTRDMYTILTAPERRILVVSDTNTGKTTAMLNASKEYLSTHPCAFVYFAAPTRALAGQICSNHGLGDPLQDDKRAAFFVNQAITKDTRLLCGTYDKAEKVLRALPARYELIVIVDEAHKEVSDYKFRFNAIRSLFNITAAEQCTKFIGLTGTPQDIDLTHYDKRFNVIQENRKPIARELLFVEYNKASAYSEMVAAAIQKEVQAGSKMLVFVNNKKEIALIRTALKAAGIQAAAVTADERTSKTYSSILNAEKIPQNIQVVLATIAIADGVSIQNAADYVCMIAPHYSNAPFFNIALIKQAANRFRETYRRLLIPIFIKSDLEEERKSTRITRIEPRYKRLMDEANATAAVIRERFEPRLDLYKPSIAEALAGLFNSHLKEHIDFEKAYQEDENRRLGLPYNADLVEALDTLKERLLQVDERAIREQASQAQEDYFSYFPFAFMQAVAAITDIKQVRHITAEEYAEGSEGNETLTNELKRLRILAAEQELQKREQLPEILTETLFEQLQQTFYHTGTINEKTDIWQTVKSAIHPDHFITLKSLIGIADYNQAITELKRIKNRTQTLELKNHLTGLIELEQFEGSKQAGQLSKTQTMLELLKYSFVGSRYSAAQRDEILDLMAKEFRGSKDRKALQKILERFFVTNTKAVKENGKTVKKNGYQLLTIEEAAAIHELETSDIAELCGRINYSFKIKTH